MNAIKVSQNHYSSLARHRTSVAPSERVSGCPKPCKPCLAVKSSFNGFVQAADNQHAAPRRSLQTIQLISADVAIQATTLKFERFAGRSAMIGVMVAVVAELLTERSIFRHFSPDTVTSFGELSMGVVSLAAAAACVSKRKIGLELLEAVNTSLTANQRSAASITGRQVDMAVDMVLNRVFNAGVIYSILAEDEDI